jgi:hypothetical protein
MERTHRTDTEEHNQVDGKDWGNPNLIKVLEEWEKICNQV